MNTLRQRAVALLSITIDELKGNERNYRGRDDAAVKIIEGARANVIAIRDRYANGAPSPLHRNAAQELRLLSDQLEGIGEKAGNKNAASALTHEAGRLNHFVMNQGELTVGDGGELLFPRE